MTLTINRIRGHSFIGSILPGADGVVVDLGMNHGHFSTEIQRQFGCRVLGVEANPMLLPSIEASGTLRPLNYAISQSGREVNFYIDLENSEASSLAPLKCKGRIAVVPSITLPELAEFGDLEQIDLLKVDIEGAEIELLQSTPAATLLLAMQICVESSAFPGFGTVQAVKEVLACLNGSDSRRSISHALTKIYYLSTTTGSDYRH